MTSGSICHKSLGGQERWHVVLEGHIPAFRAHGLCIWCSLCPWSAGWRRWSWWSCWLPLVEVLSSPISAALFAQYY